MGNISSNSLDLKTWEASEMDAQDFIPWQGVRNESHERRGAAVRAKAFVFTKLSKGFRIAEVVVDRHKIGRENEAMIGSFEQDLLYGAPEHSSKDAPFSQLSDMRTGKSIRLHLLELFGSPAADPLLQRDEIELKMAFGSCETASRNVFGNPSLDTAKSMEKFYDLQLRSEIPSYPFSASTLPISEVMEPSNPFFEIAMIFAFGSAQIPDGVPLFSKVQNSSRRNPWTAVSSLSAMREKTGRWGRR
nr:hypothetical protein Iba_chr12bCG14000 [Ipomoea batatas]